MKIYAALAEAFRRENVDPYFPLLDDANMHWAGAIFGRPNFARIGHGLALPERHLWTWICWPKVLTDFYRHKGPPSEIYISPIKSPRRKS